MRPGSLRAGDGRASVTAGPWPEAATSNLPTALASFVGRDAQVSEITTLVGEHRLVTITGTGGIGKTRTALQVGADLDEAADWEAWLIELAPVSNPSLVASAIASTLGVQEVASRPLLQTLVTYLKGKTLLLILDNCEHVIAEVAIVADALLRGCPSLRILATSREPLRVAGEHTYRLPSLSIPSPEAATRLRAADAAAYGAIELLCDRARAVDHRFSLIDDTAPHVAELCRRLDGIPLAIELAAARVNSLSITALVERLEDRFRILTRGDRAALPRQQTMRATIDWSYELLSEREQRVFERLSVFAGGCTLAAATAVCAEDEHETLDVVEALGSLVNKSMLIADIESDNTRYRLLESFREYAREKLAARGERAAFARRHALAYLELAELVSGAWDSGSDTWRGQQRQELDNWRAALEWALAARGDVAVGLRLAGQLARIWVEFALLEARHWTVLALSMVDERTPTIVLANLRHAEAGIASSLGEGDLQLASSEKALALYQELGDERGVVNSQSLGALALLLSGRIGEAEQGLHEALARARSLGTRRSLAYILRVLGSVRSLQGDLVAARSYLAEATAIYKMVGADRTAASVGLDLADFEFHAGNVELALSIGADALATLRAWKDLRRVAATLINMSAYLIALSRFDEARECAREALDVAREQALGALAARALQRLAAAVVLQHRDTPEPRFEKYIQAAQLLGFVDARLLALESSQDPSERGEHDQALLVLRDALGAEELASLVAAGATMTEDEAVEATFLL
jgi:predicted ATPase